MVPGAMTSELELAVCVRTVPEKVMQFKLRVDEYTGLFMVNETVLGGIAESFNQIAGFLVNSFSEEIPAVGVAEASWKESRLFVNSIRTMSPAMAKELSIIEVKVQVEDSWTIEDDKLGEAERVVAELEETVKEPRVNECRSVGLVEYVKVYIWK